MAVVEVITVIGVVVLSATSIGGWIYAIRRNGRSEGKMQQQVDSLIKAVGNLPCQVDSDYLRSIGGLAKAVKTLEGWLARVEEEQGTIHKRIDGIVNSGGRKRKT